jgi:hypothetical protein
MNYELTINELQVNYEWMMSGISNHEWEPIWKHSIHHMIMFDVDICDNPNLKTLPYLIMLGLRSKLVLLEYCITI